MAYYRFMKTLLLFPPQWTPIAPHFALPSLLGQLKANGYEAEAQDLNIDFYNKILQLLMMKPLRVLRGSIPAFIS